MESKVKIEFSYRKEKKTFEIPLGLDLKTVVELVLSLDVDTVNALNSTDTNPSQGKSNTKVKVISKGKVLGSDHLFLKDTKLLILATTKNQIINLENLSLKWEQNKINYSKALVTGPRYIQSRTGGKFIRNLKLLTEFDDHIQARELLMKIRDDQAIMKILDKRDWRIGTLSELHPIRRSDILGYNQNKGWEIALRLRADALDSFRSYNSIIKVFLHELAHMIWSEHDENFHALDRELNEVYNQLAKGKTVGGNGGWSGVSLNASGLVSVTQKLGGAPANHTLDRRDILANAAKLRLSREEEEMQKSCGSNSTR